MSWQAVDWVLNHSRSKGATRLVALVIAHHVNSKTNEACVAIDTIACEAGIQRGSVFRCLDALGDGENENGQTNLGEVKREQGGGRNKTNRYSFALLAAQGSLFDRENGHREETVSKNVNGHISAPKRSPGSDPNIGNENIKPSSSSVVAAFSAFGFPKPLGHSLFQSSVLKRSSELHNGNMIEIMEKVIQECDRKVPPAWYQAKRHLEKELRQARERSDSGGRKNGYRYGRPTGADLDAQIRDAAQNAGRRPN